MQTKHLKIRVSWTELALFPEDSWDEIVEHSVVTSQYHPRKLIMSDEFSALVSSLEKKYDVRFERSKDNCFFQLAMGERDDSSEDIANDIIAELEDHLEQ